MSRYDEINAILDSLGEAATVEQIEYALRDHIGREVLAVLADRAESAGAGSITEITSDDASVTITDPTGPVVDLSAGGGAAVVQLATATLTDAQIKALHTTPVQVLAAPGAGKYIAVIAALVACDTTAASYTNVNSVQGELLLETVTSTRIGVLKVDEYADLFTWGGQLAYQLGPLTSLEWVTGPPARMTQPPFSLDDNADTALQLNVNNSSNGNFTGGNAANSLTLTLLYMVLDV
jgi:hypothetical protein